MADGTGIIPAIIPAPPPQSIYTFASQLPPPPIKPCGVTSFVASDASKPIKKKNLFDDSSD